MELLRGVSAANNFVARGRPKLNEVDASSFGPKIMIRFLPAAVVAISFCPIPTPPSPSIAGH
jgi:hypothetical protein